MTLAAAVLRAAAVLESAGLVPHTARFDADLLARHVLGWDTATWLTRQREVVPGEFNERFNAAIERRRRREPIAYITGTREFYGRSFVVTPAVLIPRPETEFVVDEALTAARTLRASGATRLRAADVGTGSGCLAITLALECPDIEIVATDISSAALAVALANARELSALERVSFLETSLLADLTGLNLVVANPPYVAASDRPSLEPDVREFEPSTALFGGPDGLAVIRALVPAAARSLAAGGWLIMEFGAGQANDVRNLLGSSTGLEQIRIVRDLAGIPRVLVARKR